jgi:hypothetical protein
MTAYAEVMSACDLRVEVETNGFQGGDAGHGGYAEVRLIDAGGTSQSVCGVAWDGVVVSDDGRRADVDHAREIILTVRGDAEITNLVRALEWAARTLRGMTGMYSSEPQVALGTDGTD